MRYFLLTSANYAPMRAQWLRLLCWPLLAALAVALSGCDAVAGLWHSLTGPAYEVLDSGVGTSRESIYWLDNDRVIFLGTDEPKAATTEEKLARETAKILIWNVATDEVSVYREGVPNRYICYADGRIYWPLGKQPKAGTELGVAVYMAGPLGQETRHEFVRDKAVDRAWEFNEYTCRFVKRPAAVPGGEGWLPLGSGHGYIRYIASKEPGVFRVLYYKAPMDAPRELPFTNAQAMPTTAVFSETRGAYLMYQLATSEGQRAEWRASGCWRVWWLYPDGRTRSECLMAGPWAAYGMDSLAPMRSGFVYSVKTGSEGGSGVYVEMNRRAVKVIDGLPGKPVVSPDGCRAAFSHINDVSELRAGTPGRLTLRVVTLCRVNQQGEE